MSDEEENGTPRLVITVPNDGGEMAFRQIVAPGETARFRMGSREGEAIEQPPHWVELSEPYWMAETLVTQAQFRAWTESPAYQEEWFPENKHKILGEKTPHQNHFSGKDQQPAENLCWWEAAGYAEWLTDENAALLSRYNTDYGKAHFGLPAEAQWEYACRKNTTTEYWNGNGEAVLCQIGWYEVNSGESTHAVKDPCHRANPFGLYDLHGNVWEWCMDGYHTSRYRLKAYESSAKACLEANSPEDSERERVFEMLDRVVEELGSDGVPPAVGLHSEERESIDRLLADADSTSQTHDGWKPIVSLVHRMRVEMQVMMQDLGYMKILRDQVYYLFSTRDSGDLTLRVMRGGSWSDSATDCRSASRDRNRAGNRSECDGFRLCLFPGPASKGRSPQSHAEPGGLDAAAPERPSGAAPADTLSSTHGPEVVKSNK